MFRFFYEYYPSLEGIPFLMQNILENPTEGQSVDEGFAAHVLGKK
jgi:hypothetical protein